MTEGERIKQRRKELGLSQDELGKKLGVSKAAVSNVETGKERLTTDRLKRYAEALNTTLIELQGLIIKPEGSAYYVEMLLYSLGYRRYEDEDGNLWIEHAGKTYEVTEEDWNLFVLEVSHFAKYNMDRMIIE